MKFGKVDDTSHIDFSLPPTARQTYDVLKDLKIDKTFEVYVGCAKWNKEDLKGFYPRGTKDELTYYAQQFNSIELNATYYKAPSKFQVEKWFDKTPENFKFFPKIPQAISHYSRLVNTDQKVLEFCDAISFFQEKLGMIFLQMHENFKPKDFDRLFHFIENFPKGFPLGVEVRNEEWFADKIVFSEFTSLLKDQNKSNLIVDTAGRRDLLHMHLTNDTAFVRYVSANDGRDYERFDEWIEIIKDWRAHGLQKLYFFVHQNIEIESTMLATYFLKRINETFNLDLPYPGKNELLLF